MLKSKNVNLCWDIVEFFIYKRKVIRYFIYKVKVFIKGVKLRVLFYF